MNSHSRDANIDSHIGRCQGRSAPAATPNAPGPVRPGRSAAGRRATACSTPRRVCSGRRAWTRPRFRRSRPGAGCRSASSTADFPDKDALIRAVYERFFARSRESNRAALDPSRWTNFETGRIARLLIAGMVAGYRQRRGLLRALYLYADTHPDRRFRRRAAELTDEAFRGITDLLLTRRSDLAHPNPAAAVRLALLAVGSTLRTLVLSSATENPFGDEEQLGAELRVSSSATSGSRRPSRKADGVRPDQGPSGTLAVERRRPV